MFIKLCRAGACSRRRSKNGLYVKCCSVGATIGRPFVFAVNTVKNTYYDRKMQERVDEHRTLEFRRGVVYTEGHGDPSLRNLTNKNVRNIVI